MRRSVHQLIKMYLRLNAFWVSALVLLMFAGLSPAQDPGEVTETGTVKEGSAAPDNLETQPREDKRLFGLVPNYRTSATLSPYRPITTKEKFGIASQDSFDRGTIALGAAFGGVSQITNGNPSFGQGVAGYGRYFSTAYADLVIGDYMTEAIFPALLHQDPRYFRMGCCGGWKRLGYAAGQILFTHSDTGKTQFNYSEVLGNSAAVAISNSYYADNRTASSAISKLSSQLAVDAFSNILKEFWPEISRKFSRKNRAAGQTR